MAFYIQTEQSLTVLGHCTALQKHFSCRHLTLQTVTMCQLRTELSTL